MADGMLRFQVNVDCTGPDDEATVAALRSWFDLGMSTVAARYLNRIAAQPPRSGRAAPDGHGHSPGNAAGGQIEYRVPNRSGRPRNVVRPYSEKEYARFQSHAAEVLTFSGEIANALLDVGTLDPWGDETSPHDHVDITANLPDAAAKTLLLTMDFPPKNLDTQVVRAWRGWADEHNVTFGVVERAVDYVDTVLETCLRIFPSYRLLHELPDRLRGYGWLTIASREVGERLGGVDSLRTSGAFAEVAQTRSGSYWLQAAHDPHSYGMAGAERVFRALAPALPPGMPAPPRVFEGDLPYLIVLEDAATVTA